MRKWLLPTLWEILASEQAGKVPQVPQSKKTQGSAEQQWQVAIAALQQLLKNQDLATQGLILTAPAPIFNDPELITSFSTAIFSQEIFNPFAWMPLQLPGQLDTPLPPDRQYNLSFLPGDPLAKEQFCLVFTPTFSLAIVLGINEEGEKNLLFSFAPEDTYSCWSILKPRILLANPQHFKVLENLLQQYPLVNPDYRLVMEFSQQLISLIPPPSKEPAPAKIEYKIPHSETQISSQVPDTYQAIDVELLQALTHEVRTPLATIRTMTKLILKRRDLPPEVSRRLEMIDAECTEQINRMELIFKATELETQVVKDHGMNLTAMSLSQVLHHSIPRWQKQAEKYNISLDVSVPQKLPNVVSNPAMLDQVLSGLIENFTRTLNAGSLIQVEVNLAGDRLKMQVQYQNGQNNHQANQGDTNHKPNLNYMSFAPNFKSLGQLLMLQPETGSLSLNLNVTKNLFQALGGKLIVRQRPEQGEVMTIYLPLHFQSSN
jgi:hypothetical protein